MRGHLFGEIIARLLMVGFYHCFVYCTKSTFANALLLSKRQNGAISQTPIQRAAVEGGRQKLPLPLLKVSGVLIRETAFMDQNVHLEGELGIAKLIGLKEV